MFRFCLVSLILNSICVFQSPVQACNKCCAQRVRAFAPADELTQAEYAEVRDYFLNRASLPLKLREILSASTLSSFNSEHARRIYQGMKKSSEFDGGFRMSSPLVVMGTAAVIEGRSRLNISIVDIRMLKKANDHEAGGDEFVPLGYGERPENPREAFEIMSSFIFALFRISYDAVRAFPEIKEIVISALSVQVLPREGETRKYFLLRLLEDRLGFTVVEETHPGAKDSIVYQLRIDAGPRPETWVNNPKPAPHIFVEGEADHFEAEARELLRKIRAGEI